MGVGGVGVGGGGWCLGFRGALLWQDQERARATAMALIADITNPKILTKLTKLNLGHVRSLLLELAEHFTHEEVVC